MIRLSLLGVALAAALAACSSIEHKPKGYVNEVSPAACESVAARKIAVFFDGTANDEGSDTNVKRLHSLVTLQNRGDIASLYLLGVGTSADAVGAVTGSGINARVKIAYEFILNHYLPARDAKPASCGGRPEFARPADEVYIFGFSRGAYSARILTAMLYHAGAVEEAGVKPGRPRTHTSTELSKMVHEVVFPPFSQAVDDSPGRRERVQNELTRLGLRTITRDGVCVEAQAQQGGEKCEALPVQVTVLGLWDTVEQLGPPNPVTRLMLELQTNPPEVNVDVPNPRYGERLCNVERAYHAMAIDDNRATVFTPLLLSRSHLFKDCPPVIPMLDKKGRIRPGHLQEVWFSGAHSDVGGGYLNSALNGVSLNWMIDRLREPDTGLLPERARAKQSGQGLKFVREDPFGSSHNPAAGLWAVAYPNISRDLVTYASDKALARPEYFRKICVDQSVFARRSVMRPKEHEYWQLKLVFPGTVLVAMEPYGGGRNWHWPVERELKPESEPGPMEIKVQQYPSCDFMWEMK